MAFILLTLLKKITQTELRLWNKKRISCYYSESEINITSSHKIIFELLIHIWIR